MGVESGKTGSHEPHEPTAAQTPGPEVSAGRGSIGPGAIPGRPDLPATPDSAPAAPTRTVPGSRSAVRGTSQAETPAEEPAPHTKIASPPVPTEPATDDDSDDSGGQQTGKDNPTIKTVPPTIALSEEYPQVVAHPQHQRRDAAVEPTVEIPAAAPDGREQTEPIPDTPTRDELRDPVDKETLIEPTDLLTIYNATKAAVENQPHASEPAAIPQVTDRPSGPEEKEPSQVDKPLEPRDPAFRPRYQGKVTRAELEERLRSCPPPILELSDGLQKFAAELPPGSKIPRISVYEATPEFWFLDFSKQREVVPSLSREESGLIVPSQVRLEQTGMKVTPELIAEARRQIRESLDLNGIDRPIKAIEVSSWVGNQMHILTDLSRFLGLYHEPDQTLPISGKRPDGFTLFPEPMVAEISSDRLERLLPRAVRVAMNGGEAGKIYLNLEEGDKPFTCLLLIYDHNGPAWVADQKKGK